MCRQQELIKIHLLTSTNHSVDPCWDWRGTRDRRGWMAAGPVMPLTMALVAGGPLVAPAGPVSLSGATG